MEHSTIFEALIGGLVSGTIAAGFIWILFRLGKLERLWLTCVVLTAVITFFFGPSLPNSLMMWK
ncbi:hypothetical protein KPM23_004414 [Salmonella enterica]|nr:hypothetical protein [Salmonella enterica]EHQ0230884.1 hypothetical protein [Salmonella enterica]